MVVGSATDPSPATGIGKRASARPSRRSRTLPPGGSAASQPDRNQALGTTDRTVTEVRHTGGMLPAGQDAAEAFYRIVDAAYERRSVAVTSNIHPSRFDTIMPKTLATATVDRLLHHAHVIVTKGGSHRLADALAGKGVHPLD